MLIRLRQFLNKKLQRWQFNYVLSSQVATLVFLFSASSTLFIVWRLERSRVQGERDRVLQIADNYANDLQRSVDSNLSVTYALAALVDEYQGTIPNFKTVARDLLPLYPSADALGILPHDAEREVVAMTLKTEANNSSLEDFEFPQKTVSIEEPKPILVANFPHAVAYLPVFLSEDRNEKRVLSERGNSYFWGFTAVTINWNKILEEIYLKELVKRGLTYQLRYFQSETNSQQIIATATSTINSPVEKTFELAQTTWVLSLAPVGGWLNPIQLLSKIIFSLFFSVLLAILVKLFLDAKNHNSELAKNIYFDSLTSLPNHSLLIYRLEEIIAHTGRNHKNIAVCYLDLDSFSSINNHLGRKAGDYILVRIAKRLQKFLRKEDVIARVGEDKFVIVLQDISEVIEVKLILKRITEAAFMPISYDSEIISISTSIGVVVHPLDSVEEERLVSKLLSCAEQAMLYSKNNQKGSYTFFGDLNKTIAESSS